MVIRLLLCSLMAVSVWSKIVIDDRIDENNPYFDGKKTQIPISEDAGVELYQHWIDQAFSGLMAAVATKKMAKLKDVHKEAGHQCAKKAKSVQEHAKCVVALIDLERDPKNHAPIKISNNSTSQSTKQSKSDKLRGGMKMKTTIKRINSFEGKSSELKKHRKGTRFSEHSHEIKRIRIQPNKNNRMSSDLTESTQMRKKKRTHKSHSSKSSEKLGKKRKSSHSSSPKSTEKERKRKFKKGMEIMRRDSPRIEDEHEGDEWIGAFKVPKRSKRSIVNKSSYSLNDDSDKSPFALVAKHITNAIRKLKKKDPNESKNWKTVIAEIEQKGREIKQKRKMKKMIVERFQQYAKAAKDSDIKFDERRPLAMPDLDALEEDDEREEMMKMAKTRMANMTDDEKVMRAPINILREAVKLGLSVTGHNTSNFDDKNLKVISPRFLSLVPEDDENKEDEISLLSPSLFALHSDGDELERKTSIATLSGIGGDGQELLDMIIEASGVGDAVKYVKDEKLQAAEEDEMRGPNGQPLYWNKENITEHLGDFETRKVDVMEKLQRMYTPEQMEEMKSQGYTSLSRRQADFIYGHRSPFNNTDVLKRYKRLNPRSLDHAVTGTIREVANEVVKFEARQKDIILSPIAGAAIVLNPKMASQAIILSPVLTSSLILSPAIFGSVILSPWLFVACILSPRVLSPVILNPFGFVPIVLSPLALVPLILAPGIFNPIVLSPLVLCPFILSPQAFTPIILSPFALSPFILTPSLMSPIILSPFVLSPIILSPSYVSALVLSPYALSPLVASTGAAVSIVASPSLLS